MFALAASEAAGWMWERSAGLFDDVWGGGAAAVVEVAGCCAAVVVVEASEASAGRLLESESRSRSTSPRRVAAG